MLEYNSSGICEECFGYYPRASECHLAMGHSHECKNAFSQDDDGVIVFNEQQDQEIWEAFQDCVKARSGKAGFQIRSTYVPQKMPIVVCGVFIFFDEKETTARSWVESDDANRGGIVQQLLMSITSLNIEQRTFKE